MLNISAPRRSVTYGVTLIELLIVIAIIGVLSFPLLLTYRNYRTNQALLASADELANHTRTVHVFAREAQKQREWGIRSKDERAYVLYSTGASGFLEEQNYILESGVTFMEDFDVLFQIGTGTTVEDQNIELINTNGRKMLVYISKNGVVEVISL